jgi:phosphoribosylformylglycinamidine cyclo-ligase
MPVEDARRSFNLGVGMVAIARRENADAVLASLKASGEAAWVLGALARGEGRVTYR